MKIILGSQSFGRKEVLKRAGIEFAVLTADIDEKAIAAEDVNQLPLLIARAKAEKLLSEITEPAILITADQVVLCNGELRGKPENEKQAREYIASYKDHPATTITGVVVSNTATGQQAEAVDIVEVFFKPMPEAIVDQLLSEGRVLQAAGGFVVEHPLVQPYVNRIEGDINSVTGLPLEVTLRLIEEVS